MENDNQNSVISVVRRFGYWLVEKIAIQTKEDIDIPYFDVREIWWTNLGANIGFEQDGKNEGFERPALMIKKFNKYIFWSVPLTSTIKDHKYYHKTQYNDKEYCIILSQLKILSSKRLSRKIRVLPEEEFIEVCNKIKSFI